KHPFVEETAVVQDTDGADARRDPVWSPRSHLLEEAAPLALSGRHELNLLARLRQVHAAGDEGPAVDRVANRPEHKRSDRIGSVSCEARAHAVVGGQFVNLPTRVTHERG